MPIYEFECEECGVVFEELLPRSDSPLPACPGCGAEGSGRRLMSEISPPGRQPRGAKVRSDESRRGERESAHQERLAHDRATRHKRVPKEEK
jgi:putative FmdB family regulatory protein